MKIRSCDETKPITMYAEILKTTGNYNDEEIRLFTEQVQVHQFCKKASILEKGQTARSLYYLLEGTVQQYEMDIKSGCNVIDLHMSGEWFFDYESLVAQRPSKVCIEAYSDSRVLEISLEAVHYLTAKSISFLQLNKVLEGVVAKLSFFDQSMTPAEKYRFILDHRPRLIQAFPLKMISSYLKLTPETLSRVRNALASGNTS